MTINDLILGVNIALGSQPVSACPAFANDDNEVTVAQLIKGVNNALNGCSPPAATAAAPSVVASPSAWVYFGAAGVIAGFVSTYFTFKFLPFRAYTEPLLTEELLHGLGQWDTDPRLSLGAVYRFGR